jgi:hypothetical protein
MLTNLDQIWYILLHYPILFKMIDIFKIHVLLGDEYGLKCSKSDEKALVLNKKLKLLFL